MSPGIGAFLAMSVMTLNFILYSGRGEAERAAGEAWVRWALLALAAPALVLLGAPFVARGMSRLRERQLDTGVPIVLGVGATYLLSVRSVLAGGPPLYLDTAMGVLLVVTIGRYLEAAARSRPADALAASLQRLPTEVAAFRDGEERRVPVAELRVGDQVRVRPGELIPVDGIVAEGEAGVSQAEITGEAASVARRIGDPVAACTLNLDGRLLVEVRRTGDDTTAARIVRLVGQARAGRCPFAPVVDRVAALFVPAVLVLSLATLLYWAPRAGAGVGLMNALAVLLVACPRAVGIAAPLVSAAAVGRAAAAGVLVRAGATFERLARCRRVFLDKTGTLTRGAPRVVSVLPAPGAGEEEVLSLAAGLEAHSEHPIARAVREGAAARGIAPVVVSELRAAPGRGVVGRVGHGRVSRLVRLGTAGFTGVSESSGMAGRSLVHLSADGRAVGGLELEDEPRPFAHEAVRDLQARGLAVELISGDCRGAVAALAAGLPGVVASAELFPEGKLERIEASRARGEVPARVSHAIGDARALSRAAVGVTLVSGTDMARELADVTVLGGDLRRLGWTLGLAQHTVRHARVNLFGAFSYNAVGLVLAAQGRLSPLLGAIATVAAGLLVVLHARRLARYPLPGKPPRSGKRHGLHPERV